MRTLNRRHGGHDAIWLAVVVAAVYLGIWLWCKVTGEKPEFES